MNNSFIRFSFVFVVLGALVLIPVLLWVFMAPLQVRFGDTYAFLTSVGQLTALVGITLLSFALLLSSRTRFIEVLFEGSDTNRISNTAGFVAFTFILVHPLMLSIRIIPSSFLDATQTLAFSTDWALNLGIIALLLLVAARIVVYVHNWQAAYLCSLRQVLAGSLFLGALHAFIIPSDMSENPLLQSYVLGLAGGALITYTYQAVRVGILVKRYVRDIVVMCSAAQ